MATHFSILAWRIPWTEEPCRLWGHRLAKHQTQATWHTHKWIIYFQIPCILGMPSGIRKQVSWNSETAHFTQLTYFSAQLTLFCCCLFPVGENLLLQPMYFWCNYHFRVGMYLLLLLLSHFSRIRLCATP